MKRRPRSKKIERFFGGGGWGGLSGLGDSFIHKKVPLHHQQQSLHKLEF